MSYQIRTWVTSRKGSRNRKEINVFQRNKHKRKEIINKTALKIICSPKVFSYSISKTTWKPPIKQRRPCLPRCCLLLLHCVRDSHLLQTKPQNLTNSVSSPHLCFLFCKEHSNALTSPLFIPILEGSEMEQLALRDSRDISNPEN